MRKSIRKPMTERAIELTQNKLKRLAGDNEQLAIKILNQSVMNSWIGLFHLNEQPQRKNNFTDFQQRSYDNQDLENFFIRETATMAGKGGGKND